MTPFFSVIIPLYNKEKHIQHTIRSIIHQSYQNFEIIIVNDGSTDNSLKVAKQIEDKRIKFFSNKNQGISKARNYGVSKAKSDYIAFMDADDYWLPNHLKTFTKLLIKFPNCGLYANAFSKKIGNRIINASFNKIPQVQNWMGIVDDYFLSSSIDSIAWTSSVMIPKKIINKVGGFDEIITGAGEDIDLWIRIAIDYPIAFCNIATAVYNLSADNRVSNSNTNNHQLINLDQFEAIAKTNKSLKTYLDLNRYSIVIQYKLAGNTKEANEYINKINKDNLNGKQLFLLKRSTLFLKLMMLIKNTLRKFNINLSSY